VEETRRVFEIEAIVNDEEVWALVDTGASHSFADKEFLRRSGATISSGEAASVTLATRRVESCREFGVVKLETSVQTRPENWRFFALSLSVPIILGRDYIMSHGGRLTWEDEVRELLTTEIDFDQTVNESRAPRAVTHMPADPGCEVCSLAKIKRPPARRTCNTVRPGELRFAQEISFDLIDAGADPSCWGFNGERYVFTLLDSSRGTRWAEVRCLPTKEPSKVAIAYCDCIRGALAPTEVGRSD